MLRRVATPWRHPSTQAPSTDSPPIRLWKKIDIAPWKGTFPYLGDLDNDGRVDFLLCYASRGTAVQRMIALDSDGKVLWEAGDRTATSHDNAPSAHSNEPPCRPACTVFDIDGDGRTEVIAEFREPDGTFVLSINDGETGECKAKIPSPFDMSVREPEEYRSTRPAPWLGVAYFHGYDNQPCLIAKFEASNQIPPRIVALDSDLNILWQRDTKLTAVGHHPTVYDLDGDGREEVVFGELAIDGDGQTVFEHDFLHHADMTDVCIRESDKMPCIAVSICVSGPAYMMTRDGEILWQKPEVEVPHGQGIWCGNFLPDRPGTETIILRSGHLGDFITCCSLTGETIAEFQQQSGLRDQSGGRRYPDTPMKVKWKNQNTDSLWIPNDRALVDGLGRVQQDLGEFDAQVELLLKPGTHKRQLPAQAIAVPLVGDDRDDLVLYQPYHGEAIFIFTQDGHDMAPRPYVHSPAAYNGRNYF